MWPVRKLVHRSGIYGLKSGTLSALVSRSRSQVAFLLFYMGHHSQRCQKEQNWVILLKAIRLYQWILAHCSVIVVKTPWLLFRHLLTVPNLFLTNVQCTKSKLENDGTVFKYFERDLIQDGRKKRKRDGEKERKKRKEREEKKRMLFESDFWKKRKSKYLTWTLIVSKLIVIFIHSFFSLSLSPFSLLLSSFISTWIQNNNNQGDVWQV